ncbi:tetratricopeptide repeat protein [Streptomyces sp. NPDC002755]|uniref:tetratricopeptide repeat protein n=1 Tax=Streptomyces sp. NPDC002884 TaxID=3154544 RepID=UPI003316729F
MRHVLTAFRPRHIRQFAAVGFILAAVVGAGATVLGGSGWITAGAAGISGALGAFIPGWVDARNERAARRDALVSLPGPTPSPSVSRYLTSQLAVVPFTGRQSEAAELLTWCRSEGTDAVRLLTAPGGAGKTRLAEHVMEVLGREGWHCAQVGAHMEARAWEVAREGTDCRVLLVVDYAESRPELASLLRSVVSALHEARVLLLARSAGEWWQALAAEDAPVRAVVEHTHVQELGLDLGAGLSDRELVERAVPCFAREMGVPVPLSAEVPVPTAASQVPVLVLHAAALVAVLQEVDAASGGSGAAGGPVANTATSVSDVLRTLLGHEAHLWAGSEPAVLAQTGTRGSRAVVALACLFTPVGLDEAARLLTKVPELSDAGLGARRDVACWLRALYPPVGPGWWGSLLPDLVAEQLVCDVFEQDGDLLAVFLHGAGLSETVSALAVIARGGAHHPAAARLLERVVRESADLLPPAIAIAARVGGVLGSVVARVLDDAPLNRRELAAVHRMIPYPTVALASANLTVVLRIVQQLPPHTRPALRARWLMTLGLAYSQAGQRRSALQPVREAVDVRRGLAVTHPARYAGDLAASLDELGVRFSELGQPGQALTPTQEAVAGYRELAATEPRLYNARLAAALSNLGVRFSELSQPGQALTPTQEAVAAYRELVTTEPELHLGDLARALDNLGVSLTQLGRPEEALPLTQEAVSIRRSLAEANPDRYLGDLATSLDNLGIWLSQLARPQQALPATQEAVALRRQLMQANNDRYVGDLARSMLNLGVRLVQLNRRSEAIAPAQESVQLYQRAVAANPERYLSEYTQALARLTEWSAPP